MNIKLTKRVNGIAESATLAISAKAKRLKDEGVDVVISEWANPISTLPII